jgi:hypothetical protein
MRPTVLFSLLMYNSKDPLIVQIMFIMDARNLRSARTCGKWGPDGTMDGAQKCGQSTFVMLNWGFAVISLLFLLRLW